MTATGQSGYAYFAGTIVPFSEAKISIATHAFNYGTACFEGIRAYWNAEQEELFVLKLREHYERMHRSAHILKMTPPLSVDEMVEVTVELLRANAFRTDVYIRPILYKAEPLISVKLSGIRDDFCVYCVPLGDYFDTETGLHMGVSPWRRVDDNAIPARAKINGSYINAALASDDARAAGFDEAIMLTPEGHVAEGSSANLFLVRGGRLVTSPVSDSILEGITRGMVLELARDLGFETEVRPIDRTELYVAEEMFLCGTGVQIAPVTKVDHRPIGNGKPGPMTRALQERFFAAVRGRDERYAHWLTPVYGRVATTTPGARGAER